MAGAMADGMGGMGHAMMGMQQALAETMQGIQQAIGQMAAAAESMTGPKKIVRDASGKIIGVEPETIQ